MPSAKVYAADGDQEGGAGCFGCLFMLICCGIFGGAIALIVISVNGQEPYKDCWSDDVYNTTTNETTVYITCENYDQHDEKTSSRSVYTRPGRGAGIWMILGGHGLGGGRGGKSTATGPGQRSSGKRTKGSSRSSRSSSSGSRSSRSSSSACFTPGTLVSASRGWIAIEDIQVGEVLASGAVVQATMQLAGHAEPLYEFAGGLVLGGSHSIKDPVDGVWRRVEDAHAAKYLFGRVEPVLHNLITPDHRLTVRAPVSTESDLNRLEDESGAFVAADFMEVDDSEDLLAASLAYLNYREITSAPHAGGEGEHLTRAGGWVPVSHKLLRCFPAGAHVLLADGDADADAAVATAAVEDVRLGQRLASGGKVTATMQLLGEGEALYSLDGALVTGSHSVRDPVDGVWKHAADAIAAVPLGKEEKVLYNFITEKHRVHLARAPGALTRGVAATDFMEIEEGPELLAQNLVVLNEQDLEEL